MHLMNIRNQLLSNSTHSAATEVTLTIVEFSPRFGRLSPAVFYHPYTFNRW